MKRRGRKPETTAAKRARLDFYEEVLAKGGCQVPLPHECDGPLDPCHVLPKQRLKWIARFDRKLNESEQLAIVWDARNGIPGCRRGHTMLDSPFYSIPAWSLPLSVWEFAVDYDLVDQLEAIYPEAEQAA